MNYHEVGTTYSRTRSSSILSGNQPIQRRGVFLSGFVSFFCSQEGVRLSLAVCREVYEIPPGFVLLFW